MEGIEVLAGFVAFAALVIVWAIAPSQPSTQKATAPAVAVKGAVAI
jgi:hypothetical protein